MFGEIGDRQAFLAGAGAEGADGPRREPKEPGLAAGTQDEERDVLPDEPPGAAIVGSALLFGAGHLPIAAMLAGGLTLPLTLYVITGNSIFGIVAGFLYWRRGLEAAIIAHMSVHVVLIAAIQLAV